MNAHSVLILYNERPYSLAPSLNEFVGEFERCSEFRSYSFNTEMGFPKGLSGLEFDAVIMHYSIFCHDHYPLNKEFVKYIKCTSATKIAMFQDEHCNCSRRFRFINENAIDIIYTLLKPSEYHKVYGKYTPNVKKIVTYLPGYVSTKLLGVASECYIVPDKRSIDISYRARQLPVDWGKGGYEKESIGRGFLEHTSGFKFRMDIKVGEDNRKNGQEWYAFLADSKGCLGVEAGVSIFDVTGEVSSYLMSSPRTNEDWDLFSQLHENRIYYRTISPRHFEAAALRVCQILFEGNYSDVMVPWVHYIPLKKDFSNINEVLTAFETESTRCKIVQKAYEDLILSNKYRWDDFIKEFDKVLSENIVSKNAYVKESEIRRELSKGHLLREMRFALMVFLFNVFPGKRLIFSVVKPIWHRIKEKQSNG